MGQRRGGRRDAAHTPAAGAREAQGAPAADPTAARIRPEALADPTELTLAEALKAFKDGVLTPVNLMEAYLDRIDAYEATYLAFNARPPREAVVAAAAALGTAVPHRAAHPGTAWRPRTTTTRPTC